MRNWELLAKRMIAANQLGVTITQADGHRWVNFEPDTDFSQTCLVQVRHKQYGSYEEVLNEVDRILLENSKPDLVTYFDQAINYHDDLTNIFKEEQK